MLGLALVLSVAGEHGNARAQEAATESPPPATEARASEDSEAFLTRAFSRIEWHQLDNGMLVVLDPQEGVSTVTVAIGVAAGRRDEPEGWNGIAHVAEHALFREGAAGEVSIRQRMEALGAVDVESHTTDDDTLFSETLPSASLDAALWLEANRFAHAYSGLDASSVRDARSVVLREHMTEPSHVLLVPAVVRRLLYVHHPYLHAFSDTEDDVAAVDLASLQAFMQRAYTPERMTLALSGGFEPSAVLPQIERLFGVLRSSGVALAAPEAPGPTRTSPRHLLVNVPSSHDGLVFVWLTPAYGADGDAALDLAATVLERRLRTAMSELGVNSVVRVRQESSHLSSEFTVNLQLPPDVGATLPLRAATRVLASLASELIPLAELERARQQLLARFLNLFEANPFRATRLARRPASFPDGRYDPRADFTRYAQVDAAAVQAVVRQWLPAERRMTISLDGTHGASCDGELVREIPAGAR